MSDYSIKAEITGDSSGYVSAVDKAQKASKNLSTSVSKVVQGLGKNGLIGALGAVGLASQGLTATLGSVVKIAKQISATVNQCTEAYKNQLIAERQLDTAIENSPFVTGASAQALKDFASEMQRVSNYGDEQLLPMIADLIAKGRTEAEAMKIVKTALDMSATGTISLDTAISQLNMTINGSVGRLGQQNAELKDLTEEELKNGKAVEILGDKYKGLAQATIDTSKQLKNIKGDFKEAIGEFTLPSSDMWNRFWIGFYQNGIDVIKRFNDYLDTQIIGKRILENLQSNARVVAESTGYSVEDILSDFRYLKEQLEYLSDSEIRTLQNTLEKQKDRTQAEERMLTVTRQIIQSRKLNLEYEKQIAEEEAKKQKVLTEQQELENGIAELKDKHLKKIREQEAKWSNIKQVTGEEVKLEEKLKFYQDDLVAIMTEAGGQISTNNQYYKDQIAIINELKGQLGEVVEETTEATEVIEEIDFADFFSDLQSGITVVLKNLKNGLYSVEETVQSVKETIVNDVVKNISDSVGTMFSMLGENLAGAGHGFEDFASVALKALSEVLKSISAQLSALAVLKALTHNYAEATVALAGATASMVASGVANQVSKNLTTTKTKIDAVGDSANKAGKDLEYFIKRLQEIQSGMTVSSRNLISNISDLKSAYEEARRASSEAYDKWQAEMQKKPKYKLKFYKGGGVGAVEDTSEIDRLYDEMHRLDVIADEIYSKYKNASFEVLDSIKAEISENKTLIDSYNQIYKAYWELPKAMSKYTQALEESKKTFGKGDLERLREILNVNKLKSIVEEYNAELKILLNEQKTNIQKLLTDVYDQLASTGKNIGEKLVTSIINGAKKEDFLLEMKNYIRTNLIKMVVYTESFQDKLAEVGMTLSRALSEGFSGEGLIDMLSVRAKLNKLYDTAYANAQQAEFIINATFGDIGQTVEETTEQIEESVEVVERTLTRFEELMEDFKNEVADVGGEIGSSFVDAISDGMNQGDFLQKMKSWIKKMLVQSVVYTESMKSEIEAIGQAITKGIREGFTETSLHEIRRDLSWVFNEANKTVSSLDDILDKTFGGYAIGTNNAMSGLHLVGEAGPELVRFRGGEQVLNANNTQKALSGIGGTTINQNVTFNNLQDTTAYAMMNQFKQYNRSLAINGVI